MTRRCPAEMRSAGTGALVFVFLLWAIAGVGTAGAVPQADSPKAEDELEKGIQMISARRYAESLAVFNQFKQSAPRDSRPYFYSGMALRESGRLSAAALELQEAVRLAPDRTEYLVLQASVLTQLRQNQDALDVLAKVEKQGSNNLDTAWQELLAETYLKLWKIDDALRVVAQLGDRSPKDARIDLDRGKAYAAKGELALAVEALKKSIEKQPADSPVAYFNLGKTLYQLGELEPSKAALVKAVEQDEGNAEYLFQLGVVCLARDEVDEAIRNLQLAEPSASLFPGVYLSLGRAYRHKGDRVRAEEYTKKFQQATAAQREKDERNREADRNIAQGELRLDKGNAAEARTFFEQAALADPNRWDPHAYLAEMLLDAGDLDGAHVHLVKMEAIDPESVVGTYLMAKYYSGRGDFERALEYAERVKLSRPANSELRGFLGGTYEKLGRLGDAMREYEIAAALAPERADFREGLQRVRSQQTQAKPTEPAIVAKPR